MASEADSTFLLLFIPKIASPILRLEIFLLGILVMIVFTYWLVPGGFAWSLAKARDRPPIPGPSGLPLAGLVFAFSSSMAHRVLARIAKSLDAIPLMAFSVGFTRFLISSNPDTAREILNNSAFADRPIKESAYELLFHRAMGFAPFGEYWRNLRRISASYLFCPKRIAGFSSLRQEIGLEMVDEIGAMTKERGEVEVRRVLHFGSLNSVMMSVFGRKYDFKRKGEGLELEGLVREGYALLGTFNWSDHFPILGWLDFQGVRSRCKNLATRVNGFVGNIIEEHKERRKVCKVDGEGKDFVDVLLDLEERERLNDSDMIAVLWEMIFRGTDTVAILLEWILARMVLHQEIQSKAQTEIDTVVGSLCQVSDNDISNLPYLQSIVKEALRMHPPGPLLSWARLAIHDVHIGESFIPAGTTAMVNMWAITHDERIWQEPNEFKPERFIKEDVSVLGSDLRLAPFGSGRRVCPGKALGLATVHLWLAQLLHKFKWLPLESGVDLQECLKLSLEKKNPLVCKVVPR